jgi:REP element-mobilizing transposase RayT
MAQSLSDIIIHIVFSTKNRLPMISPEIEYELFQYICGTAYKLKSPVISINGVQDHIHILLHLGSTTSINELISKIKSNSSRWMKTKGKNYSHFSWQSGYGVFSVSRSIIEAVERYVSKQKEHHKKMSFQDEFLEMLRRSQTKYDERYLWD